DDDGVILRLYECENAKTPGTPTWHKPRATAEADTCIEAKTGDVEVSGNQIRFTIKPYEATATRIRCAPRAAQAQRPDAMRLAGRCLDGLTAQTACAPTK